MRSTLLRCLPHRRRKWSVWLILLGALCLWGYGRSVGLAADQSPPNESRFNEAKKVLAKLQVTRAIDGRAVPLKRVEEPLLSFVDIVDNNDDGTIWLWGDEGRPSMVVQLWTNLPHKTERCYSFTSLSSELVEARGIADPIRWIRWASRRPGVEFQAFPEAPQPAASAVSRLRQMKALARQFRAHELCPERFELRLLPKQVHRYSDERSGLIDGAAFLWARGSDPEMLQLVELVKGDSGGPKWQYAFARISSAALHVYLGDREVWSEPVADHRTRTAEVYMLVTERLSSAP